MDDFLKKNESEVNKQDDEEGDRIRTTAKSYNKVKHYMDYDSQPEEDLDTTPEWMKGRNTVEQELEKLMGPSPID